MQYLNKEVLLNNVFYYDIKVDDLISADSYNEEEIMKKFNSIDKEGQLLLLRCAVHVAIIGSGNKTYGSIRDQDNNVIEIKKNNFK